MQHVSLKSNDFVNDPQILRNDRLIFFCITLGYLIINYLNINPVQDGDRPNKPPHPVVTSQNVELILKSF